MREEISTQVWWSADPEVGNGFDSSMACICIRSLITKNQLATVIPPHTYSFSSSDEEKTEPRKYYVNALDSDKRGI